MTTVTEKLTKGVTTAKRGIGARARPTAESVRKCASRVHGVTAQRVSRAMSSVIILTMIVIKALMRISSGAVITHVDQALSSVMPAHGSAAMRLRTAIARLSRGLTPSFVVAVVKEQGCALRRSGALGVSARWWVNVTLERVKKDLVACVVLSVAIVSLTVSGESGKPV